MATEKKTYYKVILQGEVIIEAADESDAIAKAKGYFVTTGQDLTWGVSKVEVQINTPA